MCPIRVSKGGEQSREWPSTSQGRKGAGEKLKTSLEAMTKGEDCRVVGLALEVRQKDGVHVGKERKQRIRDNCRASGFISWVCVVALAESKMAGGGTGLGREGVKSLTLSPP